MAAELITLCELIHSNVQQVDRIYASYKQTFPSLDDPYAAPMLEEPELLQAAQTAIAAAGQLIANLRLPSTSVWDACGSMYTTAALGVVEATHVAEILREAGSNGLHIRDIASKSGVNSTKLGRCLRYLASTEHIFTELSPDVFTNNRISAAFDTGKSSEAIKANPLDKHIGTSGLAACIAHCADEGHKSSTHIMDAILDPELTSSDEPHDSPLARAWGRKVEFFPMIAEPGSEARLKRFGPMMSEMGVVHHKASVTDAFDWQSLKDGALVVDVGGGLGYNTLKLAKAFPKLRFVVQDQASVVIDSKKMFEKELPDRVANGTIDFQGHNFFTPQPIKNADAFFLAWIFHDWGYNKSRLIMSQLRPAASPTTKLFITDYVVPYACKDNSKAPAPLNGNYGVANGKIYKMDLHMYTLFNAQERTLGEWETLANGTGWKLESVKTGAGLTFVPV